jgi:hypothetical protein
MPLYQTRQRARERAEKLANGESIRLVRSMTSQVRTRIYWALAGHSSDWSKHAQRLVLMLYAEWGTTYLANSYFNTKVAELKSFLVDSSPSAEEVLDVVEAWFLTAAYQAEPNFDSFRASINRIFDEHDIAYQLVGGEIVSRDSMVMHAQVVGPALSLLHGSPKLSAVEKAYQDALRELKPGGDPGDAITDAGTALQEMLIACGASGKSLGPLMKDATKRGIIGPYDAKLIEWVSADRSTRGDAHSASAASLDDAWLAVHVVGALILCLEGMTSS